MRVTRGNADASSRHPPWAPIRIRRKSMLERLLNKITDDGSAELVYLILGSILLFAFQRLRAAYRQMRHRHFIKHQLAAYKERKRAINVTDLANGDPEFSKNNIFVREVSIFGLGKRLYIDMRADHKDRKSTRLNSSH